MGGLSRDQKQVRGVLDDYDLMIVLGADPIRMSVWSEVDPMPENLAVIHIGLVDWDIAKNYGVELGIKADVGATLEALVPVLQDVGGEQLASRAQAAVAGFQEKNWSAKRKDLVAKITEQASANPINPDWLCLSVAETLPDDGVMVNEGLTSGRYLNDLVPYRDRYGFHGLAAGGIGWGVAAAVGVAMAQAPRRVCCFSGDGSAMYSIQALWSAANQKLPITYVIANNGGYRILKQRLLAFHGNDHYVGMDIENPAIDFCELASSLGMRARRIVDPAELRPALEESYRADGPTLLDVMTDGTV
ncbi:MAG: thiamine pyrophosphate-dependent enzyme, partial [Pseudomonadota bacterium]